MASLNRVFLMGNLTRDPEVRYTPSKEAVGDLQLAVNRRYKGKDGQDHDEVCYVGVVVWGRQAETCRDYLHKGSPILVEGSLQLDQWEKDGQKQSRLRVRAIRVQFLGSPRGAEFRDGGGAEGAPPRREEAPTRSRGSQVQERRDESVPEEPAVPNDSGDDDNLPF
jgi:single-strand DNA-binding protein